MTNYTPTSIGSLSNQANAVAKINENFNAIADSLADKLDRVSGLPNHMARDLDMNSNDLLNVGAIFADRIVATAPPPNPFENSAFVNYTPQGSGAVHRTVQEKLREVVSVKDFGAIGDGVNDDYQAIVSALTAALSSGAVVYWPAGFYRISQTLYVDPRHTFIVHNLASIRPWNNLPLAVGVEVGQIPSPQTTNNLLHLPAIADFTSGVGLLLRGITLSRIYITNVINCNVGVELKTEFGTRYQNALDNTFTYESIALCDVAIRITSDNPANIIQGNVFVGNFVVNCEGYVLFNAPGVSTSAWDGNRFELVALDQTPARTNAYGLKNNSAGSVPRCTWRVTDWCGGWASTAKIIDGSFDGLDVYIRMAESIGQYSKFSFAGIHNIVNLAYNHGTSDPTYTASTVGNSRASFNGGIPIDPNKFKVSFDVNGMANGTSKEFFIYHPLADGFSELFRIDPRRTEGLTLSRLETGTVANEIIVRWTNNTGATATGNITAYATVGR